MVKLRSRGGALESLNELIPTTPEKLVAFEDDLSPSARIETAAINSTNSGKHLFVSAGALR
jgi:hypothetical protein